MELFTIFTPANKVIPLVANLPHSGMYIPQEIAEQFKIIDKRIMHNIWKNLKSSLPLLAYASYLLRTISVFPALYPATDLEYQIQLGTYGDTVKFSIIWCPAWGSFFG